MKTRILSGLIMLPLVILLVIGGYVLYAGCFAIGVMAVYEFYRGFKAMDVHPSFPIAVVAAVCLYVIGIVDHLGLADAKTLMMLWFFGVTVAGLLYLFKIEERKLSDGMATIVGIFYAVFFSYHIGLIGMMPDVKILVWLVVITAFGTDICAYFAGVFLGKHKLCPVISPKKTWEGAIGGVLGSVILCGVFGIIFVKPLMIHCLIIGLAGSVISMFGDLTASVFKRKMGIKDYGNLIPGHGGILDRFDSVLFTGPVVYYYIAIVLGMGI
ncbi:MAG: phosphatidate cytidylyltransferase [Bacillota bacterium]|nr:phosphatidate cytidylyltransferase [Bacillota bacterium]